MFSFSRKPSSSSSERRKSKSRSRKRDSRIQESNPVSKSKNMHEVKTGEQFTISLAENPTTGYRVWFDEEKTKSPVKFVTDVFIADENTEMRVGSGGHKHFTFDVPAEAKAGIYELLFTVGRVGIPDTYRSKKVEIRIVSGGRIVHPGKDFAISLKEQAGFTWTLADPTFTNGSFPIQLKMRNLVYPETKEEDVRKREGGYVYQQFVFTVGDLKMETKYSKPVLVPITFLYHRGDQMSDRQVHIETVFYSNSK